MDAFEQYLQTERGLASVSARTLRRHLQAAIAAAGVLSPFAFVQRPDLVVPAIERLYTHGARRALHPAIRYFLDMNANTLPSGATARCEAAFDRFPGRMVPQLHLVDRDLGGSDKRVRRAPPFAAGDAERLFRITEEDAAPARRARDRALMALHCWSGFKPGQIGELRWEAVLPAFVSEDQFPRVPTSIKGRVYPIVVDRHAITALEAHWRASGEPPRGTTFLQTTRSGKLTTASHLRHVVAGYLGDAELGGVDRRRLNAPFALSLRDRGWDEKVVADAFGYQRVRSLREHIRPVEEARAQRQSVEWLTANPSDAEINLVIDRESLSGTIPSGWTTS